MLPNVKVSFQCDNAALQRTYDLAVEKSRLNLKDFGGKTVLVEGGGYKKIWLETQPMGGEMYAFHNIEAAYNNQLMFIEHQRSDGRLPGAIECRDGIIDPQYFQLQGFCFPFHALNMYFIGGRDRQYLDALIHCLINFDTWLWKTRDSNYDGILDSYCVYDTGEDRAVRYGDAPNRWPDDLPPTEFETVPMASMDITSFSYACREALTLAFALRRDHDRAITWYERAKAVSYNIKTKLWDERRGACYDRDSSGRVIDILCHNTLRCMYWHSIDDDMARRFVDEHVLNAHEFWTKLPLPSVSVSDPAFRNAVENNWSGQCEGLTWQRAIHALENYGYNPLVTRLGHIWLDNLVRHDNIFAQQFDPFTGEPSRVGMDSHKPIETGSDEPIQDAYGPTMLASLEYIAHMWGIDMHLGKVWFSAARGLDYNYSLEWNGHSYTIASNGKTAEITIDGNKYYTIECGQRLITSEDGEKHSTVAIE